MPVCLSCKRDLTYYYFSIRIHSGICRACTALEKKPTPPKRPTHKKKKKAKVIPLPRVMAVPDIDPAQFRQVFQ